MPLRTTIYIFHRDRSELRDHEARSNGGVDETRQFFSNADTLAGYTFRPFSMNDHTAAFGDELVRRLRRNNVRPTDLE